MELQTFTNRATELVCTNLFEFTSVCTGMKWFKGTKRPESLRLCALNSIHIYQYYLLLLPAPTPWFPLRIKRRATRFTNTTKGGWHMEVPWYAAVPCKCSSDRSTICIPRSMRPLNARIRRNATNPLCMPVVQFPLCLWFSKKLFLAFEGKQPAVWSVLLFLDCRCQVLHFPTYNSHSWVDRVHDHSRESLISRQPFLLSLFCIRFANLLTALGWMLIPRE